MLTRRHLLIASSCCLLVGTLPPARAQTAQQAAAFIQQTGQRLVAAVNGGGSDAERKQALAAIVEQTVDVDGVARFCLGRFWNDATPAQRQDYLALFHRVLSVSITGHLGEYRGVTFGVLRTQPAEGHIAVVTTVARPNTAPAEVQWVVDDVAGQPKIIDVVAEGTSLRLTQRSDYASFIARNGNSVQALIDAIRRQVGG